MFKEGDKVQLTKKAREVLSENLSEQIYTVECSCWLRVMPLGLSFTFIEVGRPEYSGVVWYPETLTECLIRIPHNSHFDESFEPGGSSRWIFPIEFLEPVEPPKPYTTNKLGDFPKREGI